MLQEVDYVLERSYLSQSDVRTFLAQVIKELPRHAGKKPRNFWRSARLLDIQREGNSQKEIRKLFLDVLEENFDRLDGDDADDAASTTPTGLEEILPNLIRFEHLNFVYLDDFLFSGDRIVDDLSGWIQNEAPPHATVYIVVMAAHTYGKYRCGKKLKEQADLARLLDLEFEFLHKREIENRRRYRDTSEVLWPAKIPNDADLEAYMAEEWRFPFEPRQPGGQLKNNFFSSEERRQLLESEMLLAGMYIRTLSKNPASRLRPLGYSPFGLGFGSVFVTYRNCPNNAPLAFWWGDPKKSYDHPLSQWYPLLQRKTY